MNFKADLHCHSCYSDGTDSPEELVCLAMQIGLSGLSITDHDTVGAYPNVLQFAQAKDFPVLPGAELTAVYKGTALHVLAYGFSLESKELLALCKQNQKFRQARNQEILHKLNRLGIAIGEDDLDIVAPDQCAVGRVHIAKVLVKRGAASTVQEAFLRYLGEGKAAYEPGEQTALLETINIIHRSGGIAILAHPHFVKLSLLKKLLELPFDGLEGYYASFHGHYEKKWEELACQKQWLVVGGSDYHGSFKVVNKLGSSWVKQETFDKLYALHLQSNSRLFGKSKV